MKENLSVSRESILKAAEENPEAARVLETLFPSVFEDTKILCRIGTIFKRIGYPNNVHALFKWNGEVRILNITSNYMWKSARNLKVSSLKSTDGTYITVGEFTRLTGGIPASNFDFSVEVCSKVESKVPSSDEGSKCVRESIDSPSSDKYLNYVLPSIKGNDKD